MMKKGTCEFPMHVSAQALWGPSKHLQLRVQSQDLFLVFLLLKNALPWEAGVEGFVDKGRSVAEPHAAVCRAISSPGSRPCLAQLQSFHLHSSLSLTHYFRQNVFQRDPHIWNLPTNMKDGFSPTHGLWESLPCPFIAHNDPSEGLAGYKSSHTTADI